MADNVIRAIDFAKRQHAGQVRKYTNEPYLVHPFAVAGLVASVWNSTEDMIVAALLHDVVEDCDATVREIEVMFGYQVAKMVYGLTDVSKLTDGNRGVRKEIDLQHTAKADPNTKTIKLADLIDNSKTIIVCGDGFARIYMAEKKKLLRVLKAGDAGLWDIANKIVENYYAKN